MSIIGPPPKFHRTRDILRHTYESSTKNGGIRPIVVVFDFPGADIAQYHKVFELGGRAVNAQPKRYDHVCYRTDTGFTVIDIWEDEASFEGFGPIVGPALAGAGLDAKPIVYPVEATMGADGEQVVYGTFDSERDQRLPE